MICPFCENDQLIVTNSRPTGNLLEIWRRRKCLRCGEIFTTHEKIDLSCITVVKRSGKRTKYNRAKLYSSIYHVISGTKKIDRGTAGDISEKIMKKIEKEILSLKKKEISTENLFQISTKILSETYPDSSLRYIAYFSKNLKYPEFILQSALTNT